MSSIRIFLAELLLRLVLTIAPHNEDGIRLAKHIAAYVEETVLTKEADHE